MSAVGDLRNSTLAGQIDSTAAALATLELADRVAALEAKVFPPQPQASDAVVVGAEPISVDRPQLTGS